MKQYRVIWFDDEFRDLNIIKEKATLSDIELIGFDNAKDGLEELRRNGNRFDAAVVDGNFRLYPGGVGAINDEAFAHIAKQLLTMNMSLPWFILSGQLNFTSVPNKLAEVFKDGKVYDKASESDLHALWRDIKAEVDKKPETRLRNLYQDVFEACTEKYVGVDAQKPLLQILKNIEAPSSEFNDQLYFNQIRIILESVFRAANKLGLLHDKCINARGEVNLAESSLFLAGEETKYSGVSCSKAHLPRIMAGNVKSILFITGAASHTPSEGKDNLNLSEYKKFCNTHYLLNSLTFQLMDVLVWFKQYADENRDVAQNKSYWVTIQSMTSASDRFAGKVIRIAENGFGTFSPDGGGPTLSILPKLVIKYGLKEESKIVAITKLDEASGKRLILDILTPGN